MTHPYRDHAFSYLRAGWRGVLWLRPGTKWPPPKGYTGYDGDWPYPADVQAWTEDHPDANIALRMPEDVVGLDVDAYGDKPGADTLALMEANLGPLPPTILSSSRTDGVSGIRLFRCPPHPSWPNQAGPGIEIIHHGHRYAVVAPSLHPEGGTYRWLDQRTGEIISHPPRPDQLAELPPRWLEYLQAKAGSVTDKADVADDTVSAWLAALREGAPCDKVTAATDAVIDKLAGGGRHDAMVEGTARLVAYGAWGHAGTGAALSRLYDAFIAQATKPGEAQRTKEQAHAEWRRAISGAVAMHHRDKPRPAEACSCPLPAFDPNVERDFWEARPALTHLRDFARARRTSPWAVLAITLTRMIVTIPPHYVLPAIIGGEASLNLFVGIVARSGGGKGASEAAAADALDVGPVHSSGVGSGEGILHQYVTYKPPNRKTGDPGGVIQHNEAVLFTASEVDTLGALHQRQSSTLLSELRKVYMGEELSFAYVDPTKRLKVGRHRYRAGLVVGIQPTRAGVLLDDVDGGTPQRFVWMPATDADMPDEAPDEPPAFTWKRPIASAPGLTGRVVLEVCEQARTTIDREHVKRNRGDGDALDGHALLTRLKWAAALAILDERLNVNDEDWQLASVIMAMSDHVRGEVIQSLNERRAAANTAKGLADAERDIIREETVTEAGIKRVCRVLVRRLEVGERSRADLRKAITSTDRRYFDAAIERLIEAGQVEADEVGRGTTYRLAGRVA